MIRRRLLLFLAAILLGFPQNLLARYYVPQIGRFLQEDSEFDSNLYSYGLNNPLTYSDHSGAFPIKAGAFIPITDFVTNTANAPANGDPTFEPSVTDSDLALTASLAVLVPVAAFAPGFGSAGVAQCSIEASALSRLGLAGFTRHGLNQVISRGLRPSEILDILRNPIRILPGRGDVTRFIGQFGELRINSSGKVVTAIRFKAASSP